MWFFSCGSTVFVLDATVLFAFCTYRTYHYYLGTLTPYHTCPNITFISPLSNFDVSKTAGRVTKSVDPDQTPHSGSTLFAQACLSL